MCWNILLDICVNESKWSRNFQFIHKIDIFSQLVSTKMMTWRRSSCCLHFCYWNWNWKPFSQFSWESLDLKLLKHWSSRNWPCHWLLDSSHTTCSRSQPLQPPVWKHPQQHHHHTIQVAGNQVPLAVVHMPVSGIHRHKIWPTAHTIQAEHHPATAVAHHQPQPPQSHPPIQPFKVMAFA